MRLTGLLLFLLTALTSAAPFTVTSTDPDGDGPWPAAPRVEGRLLIQFRQPIASSELRAWGEFRGLAPQWTSAQGESYGLASLELEDSELGATLEELRGDPFIKHLSPDYIVTTAAFTGESSEESAEPAARFPNDPRFKDQWHLQMIGVTKAWKKKAHGSGVRIALVDSGVAYRDKGRVKAVEDLAESTFADGYDFIDKDRAPVDQAGYGTHSAGILAQSTNNKIGTAGIAFEATIIPVRVLDKEGRGSFSGVSDGIRYAADNGAQVIVMGFGTSVDSEVVEDACIYAAGKGCLLVGAGGVDGGDHPGYPAAYEQVLGVGAVDNSRTITNYSSQGVDLVAPGGYASAGEGILQNTIHAQNPRRSGYLWMSGTNCAAATVGGVAAQVIACGVTDPAKVREILLTTTKTKRDKKVYGAGIVLSNKAVNKALSSKNESRSCLFFASLLLLLFALGPLYVHRKSF